MSVLQALASDFSPAPPRSAWQRIIDQNQRRSGNRTKEQQHSVYLVAQQETRQALVRQALTRCERTITGDGST